MRVDVAQVDADVEELLLGGFAHQPDVHPRSLRSSIPTNMSSPTGISGTTIRSSRPWRCPGPGPSRGEPIWTGSALHLVAALAVLTPPDNCLDEGGLAGPC